MSDDLHQLRQAMTAVGGHLQDLQAEQSATTRELSTVVGVVGDLGTHMGKLQEDVGKLQEDVGKLQEDLGYVQRDVARLDGAVKNLQARSVHMEATTVALGGTFASIEQILTRLLEDRAKVESVVKQNEELTGIVSDLAARVEALERRAS
ncbi:MAG: hypothetical protein AB7S38_31895 [Vulcanimicrobiota bacterium]